VLLLIYTALYLSVVIGYVSRPSARRGRLPCEILTPAG